MGEVSPAFVTLAHYDDASCSFVGGVYDAGGKLQRHCQRPTMGAYDPIDPETLPADFAPAKTLPHAVYAGRFFQQFGHFLIETLPAVHAAATHGSLLLMHPWPAPMPQRFVSEEHRGPLLEALGIAHDRIVLINEPLRVDTLITPAFPPLPMTGRCDETFLAAFRKIRDNVLGNGPDSGSKLYLSRSRFTRNARKILNEPELEAALQSAGFEIVYPEELPVLEQVRLAAGASVIVGADGSQMHLCHFMAPGTLVVCLHTRPFNALDAVNRAAKINQRSVKPTALGRDGKVDTFTVDIDAVIAAATGAV